MLLHKIFSTLTTLADKLWEKKLKLVGTMGAEKGVIPSQLKKIGNCTLHDIKFGFQNEKAFVLYALKLNKTVILLSTEHHGKSIKAHILQQREKLTHSTK